MSIKVRYMPDEFRAEFLDKGFLDFDLKIEETYREVGWSMWEAIREFGQNALDATENLNIFQDYRGTVIEDTGTGVQVKHFVFRTFKKRAYERGQFGEGMKLAILTCLREGYPVEIRSVGIEAYGVLVWSDRLEGWMLNIPHREGYGVGTTFGTRITILNYFGEMYKDRFRQFLGRPLVSVPSTVTEPVPRRLELFDSPSGRIYIRDIYLQNIDSVFSYNLWDFEPSPDRHGPKEPGDLNIEMARLWYQVHRRDLLELFLIGVKLNRKESETYLTYEYRRYPYVEIILDNREQWKEAFVTVYGKNTVVDNTGGSLRAKLEYHGYTTVSLPWRMGDALAWIVGDDKDKVLELRELQEESIDIPDEHLTAIQYLHLSLLREIKFYMRYPVPDNIRAAELPVDRVTLSATTGQADTVFSIIRLDISVLNKFKLALETFMHEMGHIRAPGKEHHDPYFLNTTTAAAAEIVEIISTKPLPERWKDVDW